MSKFHLTETEGFPFELKDALVGKKDCVIPVTLGDNVIRLHQFLFDEEEYVPSKQVDEISRQIGASYCKKQKSKKILEKQLAYANLYEVSND